MYLMRVYLCSYIFEEEENAIKREKSKSRSDLTDYPQYNFDNTLNNTADFEPFCFIEVEPQIYLTKTNPGQTICDEAERLWEVHQQTGEPADRGAYLAHVEKCPEDFIYLKSLGQITKWSEIKETCQHYQNGSCHYDVDNNPYRNPQWCTFKDCPLHIELKTFDKLY